MHSAAPDVRAMLQEVTRLAQRLVVSEYHMQKARSVDPRLPSHLLTRKGSTVPGSLDVTIYVNQLLVGAEVAGRYRLDGYISCGAFGHGCSVGPRIDPPSLSLCLPLSRPVLYIRTEPCSSSRRQGEALRGAPATDMRTRSLCDGQTHAQSRVSGGKPRV